MTELLAPAGNMEALKAAVANGCDAVYLGMRKFGARAYSLNFDSESLREAVEFAHLRDVRVYVTMNTIVFEDETEDMKCQLKLLDEIGADGVIVQDLAVFDYAKNNFPDLEVHCSTQMGIDDLEGTLLFKELGARRVVLARELSIEKVKEIKKKAQLPVEVFVHGALCVSYSGNCIMSGLIGYRSGNRGRCVGSCRKLYEVADNSTGKSLGKSYILSTKDLNTIENINELKGIDSLKIEGRMKEPVYVANVVSKYRQALDGKTDESIQEDLVKTFNRTYTKGYLFHEDRKDITNIIRPNNFGYEAGRITGFYKGMYEITLSRPLFQNDVIRIDHNNEDINLSVVKLYDKNGNLINKSDTVCYIKFKEKASEGDIVYKTRDSLYYKELENMLEGEYRRFDLNIRVYAYPDSHLVIDAEGFGLNYVFESEEILSEALNNPTSKEQIVKQFSRLKDTVFKLGEVEFEEYNAFIPVKLLNNARREIVQSLYRAKLERREKRTDKENLPDEKERIPDDSPAEKISFEPEDAYLTAAVTTKEQYDTCVKCGIKEIYFDNIVRRNHNDYREKEGMLLIGGYGGIYRYRNTNPFVTDYSLNVVNSVSCHELHRLGAERVTLSYELNKNQIRDLIASYYEANDGYPRLEMIVYGRAPLMFTEYCPLKKLNQCGVCRSGEYVIKDEYGEFPVVSHEDCTTTILNGKILNLIDEIPSIKGIEAFRLDFTVENEAEVERIVRAAQKKLNGTSDEILFNRETDTRGHYNSEII